MNKKKSRRAKLTPSQRKKANARNYVKQYVKRGNIEKTDCLGCGSDKVEKHHRDYEYPLEIRWLCKKCHLRIPKDPEFAHKIHSFPCAKVFSVRGCPRCLDNKADLADRYCTPCKKEKKAENKSNKW